MSAKRRRSSAGAAASTSSNRWIIPTVALFVVLPVGAAIAQAVGGGNSPSEIEKLRADRTGSASLGREATPLLPDDAPASFSIDYRVTETASDTPSLTNERVNIRRPFDAEVTIREGHVLGKGAVRGRRVSVLTKLAQTTSSQSTLLTIPPALATSDVRFGAALDQAIEDGDIAIRERRRVAGRECQVFRAGSSLQAGVLTPYEPGSQTFADVCIDAEGLLLEEVWTLDGKRVQRRVAADVRTDVTLDDDLFTMPAGAREIGAADGGGSARLMDPGTRPPGAFWELPADQVPSGFELHSRWAVVAPRLDVLRDPTRPQESSNSISTVTVYVRGADVLMIDQGAVTGTGKLPESETARGVDLGGLGQGFTITDFRMNEVRAQSGPDFVRVSGTVPLPMLVEAARALTVVPGG